MPSGRSRRSHSDFPESADAWARVGSESPALDPCVPRPEGGAPRGTFQIPRAPRAGPIGHVSDVSDANDPDEGSPA
jgi:hypothetical protein